MEETRTERVAVARTESVFREVNERIAEGAERLDVQEANFLREYAAARRSARPDGPCFLC